MPSIFTSAHGASVEFTFAAREDWDGEDLKATHRFGFVVNDSTGVERAEFGVWLNYAELADLASVVGESLYELETWHEPQPMATDLNGDPL